MRAMVLSLLLRALPGLPPYHADNVAKHLADALTRDRSVDPVLAVAILFEESKGRPRACSNDTYGGSARGLFQIRVPHSRCGDRKSLYLYDVRRNVYEGVKIISMLKRTYYGDLARMLKQYSGGSVGYLGRVQATMTRIQGP